MEFEWLDQDEDQYSNHNNYANNTIGFSSYEYLQYPQNGHGNNNSDVYSSGYHDVDTVSYGKDSICHLNGSAPDVQNEYYRSYAEGQGSMVNNYPY